MTPADLRDVAVRLAREAGEMALAGRRAGRVSATTKSSPTDMVTEFDRRSERMICDGLAAARPDDAIVGEEGASTSGTTGLTWH
ncbi:MAG: inositol monophosphatase family protein, partial [Actinomycetota bacterium]